MNPTKHGHTLRRAVAPLTAFCLLALVAAPAAAGKRGGGGGGHNVQTRGTTKTNFSGGGGGGNRNTNLNKNRNTNVNSNRNTNVNVNSNRNVNVDVDVHHRGGYYGGCCGYNPVATAVAVTAATMVTAAVVGSIVNTVPSGCMVTVINGISYQQCGSTWYQPQYAGGGVQYVVVGRP
jgi:hypothetical protein